MARKGETSMADFRAMVRRAGLDLTPAELESLKPMYEYYARQIATLGDVDLEAEDLAMTFSPGWDAPRQAQEVP